MLENKIMNNYICKLPPEIRKCEYRTKEGNCNFINSNCGFIEREHKEENYKKEEKWFEKYYKK